MKDFYYLALKNEEEIRKTWGKKYGTLAKIFTRSSKFPEKIHTMVHVHSRRPNKTIRLLNDDHNRIRHFLIITA